MSIEAVILSNHLILCCSLLLLPSIFPSIRVFSSESAFHIRWPKYWRFRISFSSEYSGLISFRMNWFDLLGESSKGLSGVFSSTTVPSHWSHSPQQAPSFEPASLRAPDVFSAAQLEESVQNKTRMVSPSFSGCPSLMGSGC